MATRAGISITTESVFTVALRYTDEFMSRQLQTRFTVATVTQRTSMTTGESPLPFERGGPSPGLETHNPDA